MKVKDLKSGYVVELRNGERFIVTRVNQNRFIKVIVNRRREIFLADYDDNLKFHSHINDRTITKLNDIVKVWGLSNRPDFAFCVTDVNTRPLLWERREPKKLTIEEIEKALGYPIEIISEVHYE